MVSIFRAPILLAAAITANLTLGGCAHHPRNAPLEAFDDETGYRFNNVIPRDNDEKALMILSFSGGGTRAAAFAYGVLEELARTDVLWAGRKQRLLDEIDAITAVSGGGFTAAYFGLFGDRIFQDFETRFLKRNVQAALMARILLNPYNWFRMASPSFGRSDIAGEYFDRYVFDGRTFGDLLAARSAWVTINATELVLGARFEFNQAYFNVICSDISAFPVARAVAASSAVPIVLSAVTLENFAGSCGYALPNWVTRALDEPGASGRLYNAARNIQALQSSAALPFLHLFDGGLADNLGLRAALTGVLRRGGITGVVADLGLEDLRKVVFIVVNAETTLQRSAAQSRSPTLVQVINSASSVPLQRYSYETVNALRRSLKQWQEAMHQARCGPWASSAPGASAPAEKCPEVSFNLIEVSFSAHPSPEEREYLQTLPTSFNLPDGDVDRLRAAGAFILRRDPEYRRLLREEEWFQRRESVFRHELSPSATSTGTGLR